MKFRSDHIDFSLSELPFRQFPIFHGHWTHRSIVSLYYGDKQNICKYVCIYGVTGVRFVDPYVRGYVDNAYISTDTEALLNENRKDGYNSQSIK